MTKYSKYLFVTHLLSLMSFLSCISNKKNIEKLKPNIVFIMADDLGFMDLPIYGNKFNESPNISKLASQGLIFSNAYAAPVCSPTRASIQSGQYPARVGIFDFIPGHWRPFEEVIVPHNKHQSLPTKIFTIGEALQRSGYKTGYFGKWHLGFNDENHPKNNGYDQSYVYSGGGFYNPKFVPEFNSVGNKRLSEVLTDMSTDFIRNNKDEPFFLFLSHYDVHVQLDADQHIINKYLKKEKTENYPCNAVYSAMIEHLDESVGAVMKSIESEGLYENTIFIFYSDNGGVDNRYDNIPLIADRSLHNYPDLHPLRFVATSNTPLRSGKGTLYEGGIKVPLIVRWPSKIKKKSKTKAIVSSVDFYPTFIDIAQGELPENQIMDGISIHNIITKNIYNKDREVFTHYPVYHHDQPMSSLRKGDWKIIQNLVTSEFSLFNLKFDVSEMTDLKFSHPKKLNSMKFLLQKWQDDTGAQMPIKNSKFDQSRRYEWGKNPFSHLK